MVSSEPNVLQPLLTEYVQLLEQELAGCIEAVYLVGSIALGAFDVRFSDIDFIAVMSRPARQDEIRRLRSVHQTIRTKYPRWGMEGSYFQWADLGRPKDQVAPYPCYHDNRFHPHAYHDLNLVAWWMLKNRGIAVRGPATETLAFTVDWDQLIAEMRVNLNTYWRSWTRRPVRLALLLSDWGIQWTVLGVLRQFYTFRENAIISKVEAGQYALSCLPERWHPLVREAINIREAKADSYRRSRTARAMVAVRFLRYIIATCGEYASLKEC